MHRTPAKINLLLPALSLPFLALTLLFTLIRPAKLVQAAGFFQPNHFISLPLLLQ
jgi:hypothetical protein